MKTTKRILSLLLAVALVLSIAPTSLFTPASAAVTLLTTSTSAQYHLKRMMIAHGDYGDNADGYQIQVTGNVNLAQSFPASTIKGWTGTLSNAPAWNDTVAQELMDNYMRAESNGNYSFAYVFPSKIVKVNVNGGYTATYYFWSDTPTTTLVSGGGTIVFKLRDSGALANAVAYMASGNLTNKSVANSQQFLMQVSDGDVSTDVTLPAYVKLTVPSGKTMKADNLTLTSHATSPGNIDGEGEIWVAGTVTNPENISGPTLFKYATTAEDLADALEGETFDGVVLGSNITSEDAVEVPAGKTIDFNGNVLTTDSYSCSGTERNRESDSVAAPASPNVGSAGDLDAALEAGLTAITLTGNINYNDVLDIPSGTTIDLDGNDLYVTGLVNSGTLTKNGGKLWANVSTDATQASTPSTADVSNIWAANEELLREGTKFDGIRLTANITGYNNAVTSGAEGNKASILPNMAAEGAFASGLYRATPRIPSGKTLDLNGYTLVALAANTSFGTTSLGTGTIVTGGGEIKLRVHNQGGFKFAVQSANAHPGVVSEIRYNNGSGSINTLGNATGVTPYPVPAGVALATNGGSFTNVVFECASEADFTREGTNNASKITVVGYKIIDDITLTDDVDIGAVDIDYDNHSVTGGEIITTGTESNKPISASPDVGTKAELDLALDAGLTAITLTDDIDYNAVLTIPAGTTIDLDGNDLYVTGLTGSGTITKNGGKLWANVSTSSSIAETPTAASVANIWAANEVLLADGTDFDGIRLTDDIGYVAAVATANSASRATILPNMAAAGAFVGNAGLGHAVAKIPEGKTLDLNGYTFNMPAAQGNMNVAGQAAGTILTNGGKITAYFYGIANSVPNLVNALALASAHPGIVTRLCHNANNLDYTGYVIPSGITLGKNGGTASNVTFAVANEADFTRDGTALAAAFKLVDDITLEGNINVGTADVDYGWHLVTGGTITTTGDETNKLTPNVGTKALLDKALEAGLPAITLTADIDYNDVLSIPDGVTINLDDNDLYVTGLTGSGTITKNSGKLWAKVSTATSLTAAPTAADVSNLWAADEVLLDAGTDFDGIYLAANITATSNPYNTGTNDEVNEWRKTYLPNMQAAGAFVDVSGSSKYGIIKIASGKTLDLNGKTLTLRATQPTLGAGDIVNGGSIVLWYSGNTSSNGNQILSNAVAIANERPGLVSRLNQTGGDINYTSYPIPSGVELNISSGTKVGTVTFIVANEADFTRTGYANADVFKLANDITLTDDVDLGSAALDCNGYYLYVTSQTVTADSITKNGGGIAAVVTNESELRTAVSGSYDKVVIGANITLTANLNANNMPIEVAAGYTFSTGGYALSKTVVSGEGTFDGEVSAAETTVANVSELTAALAGDSDVIKLTEDIDFGAVLTIPAGKTVDLNGNDLYITGLVNNGFGIVKNEGTLWANVSTNTKLTAAPTMADVSNIWAANEMLLAGGSQLDGIRLVADITDYGTSANYAVTNDAARSTVLPNMLSEGAFTSGLQYATFRIPSGKTLDLSGHTLVMVAANETMGTNTQGTGTVVLNGGELDLRVHNQSTFRFAVAIANNYPGLVTEIRHQNTTGSVNTLGNSSTIPTPVPAGVELATNGTVLNSVVFMCANEADFTRTGTNSENINVIGFKLADNITLTQDLNLGDRMLYLYDNYSVNLNGHSIITTGTIRAEITDLDDLLRPDMAAATEVRIKADITLDEDLDLRGKNFNIGNDAEGNGYTLDLAGHTLDLGSGALTSNFGFITDASTASAGNSEFGLVKAGSVAIANTGRNLDITGLNEATDAAVRNAYQPLYDSAAGGYRFFQIANNVRTAAAMDDGKLTFKFIFNFSNAAAWDLVLEGDSEMAFWFSLMNAETLDGEATSVEYYLNAETMADYAAKQKEQVGKSSQYVLTASIRAPYYSDEAHYNYNEKYVWSDPYLGSTQSSAFAYENHGNTKFSPKYFDGSTLSNP